MSAGAASSGTTAVAGTVPASVAGAGAPFEPRRRRRPRDRLWTAAAGGSEATGISTGRAPTLRRIAAPTSPSAQRTPDWLNTSTCHTTVPIVDAGCGGRFWVNVQRAEIVSPARNARGNFHDVQPHSATSATGTSMDPRPIAVDTTSAGGAYRGPWAPISACGDRSAVMPENRAMSASEIERPRVVHSPPSGSSSKERGCRSASL